VVQSSLMIVRTVFLICRKERKKWKG